MVRLEVLDEVARLLNADPRRLDPVERQKRFVAGLASRKCPCPKCQREVSQLDAGDEQYELGASSSGEVFACPGCGAGLRVHIPLMIGSMDQPWAWVLR